MPNSLTLTVRIDALPSPRLRRMARQLQTMARALDEMQTLELASGRYERSTDAYQAELLDAYDAWVKRLLQAVGEGALDTPEAAERATQEIIARVPALRADLQAVAQEFLPDAVRAMGDAYVPSADAYRLIADAITENDADLEMRLMPDVEEKLLRAVKDSTPLADAAAAFEARVAGYAGSFWVLIQRLIGDFLEQAQTADDEIYPVRWVRTKDDASCDSCIAFAGEYESYNAMLEKTFQCVPGYFFNSPYKSACWGYCRCHLEAKINGKWSRL